MKEFVTIQFDEGLLKQLKYAEQSSNVDIIRFHVDNTKKLIKQRRKIK